MSTAAIVSKVWSFCHTLRDDGVSYGDYLEQLTYLIFLKMADEYARPPYNREVGIPPEYGWPTLRVKRGAELEVHYVTLLRELGAKPGMLGQIFTKAQNKIQDPAKLYRLIDMISETDWVMLGADVKGDIYEGLLEKNAEDTKSGAGQYFTPRALIRAMVACMRPAPGKTIADPACGTGGFFLAAYDFLTDPANYALDRQQKDFLKHQTFHGNEIVANTRRLCLMNMFLHNIGEIDGESTVSSNDALVAPGGQTYDYVLANPPFGKKSSMSFTNEEGEQETDALTYNHEASPEPWTREVWYYDYRTNIHHTLKKRPMRVEEFQDFITCYQPENRYARQETWDAASNPEGRWRKFTREELLARDKTSLDIFWLKDKSLTDLDNLPDPDELAAEIIDNLEAGLDSFRTVLASLAQMA